MTLWVIQYSWNDCYHTPIWWLSRSSIALSSCAHKIKLIQNIQIQSIHKHARRKQTATATTSHSTIKTSNMKFIQLSTIAYLAIFATAPGVSAALGLGFSDLYVLLLTFSVLAQYLMLLDNRRAQGRAPQKATMWLTAHNTQAQDTWLCEQARR